MTGRALTGTAGRASTGPGGETSRVFIRADASVGIGSGHIMRCLTLADELKDLGAEAEFICRTLPGDLCDFVESKGYRVHRLELAPERDAEETAGVLQRYAADGEGSGDKGERKMAAYRNAPVTLIVDHYGLDAEWESQIRPFAGRIAVIDDLADRRHDCDLLLDQNLHEGLERRYQALVPPSCRLFLGPAHALLRPEFTRAREALPERDGAIRRVLVFFGGSDPTGETAKAIEAIRAWNRPDTAVDVVVGGSNPRRAELERVSHEVPGVRFHCQVDNMAELMAKADVALGAGGSTSWERCYLGLPAGIVAVADNQLSPTEALAQTGAIRNLGWHEQVTASDMLYFLQEADGHPALLWEMSRNAIRLMGERSGGRSNPFIEAIAGSGVDA